MTPDANDLCVFAIKRGSIEKRLDINYNLPQYAALISKLRSAFDDRLKPIGEIADVICGPFGSAIKNGDYQESGIPLIRITNISKAGYMDYSDLVYVSESLGNSLGRTQVSAGDIVISQRGSLGQCAVVDDRFQKLNISANIIAIKNIRETSARFIHDYLLSSFGQKMLERSTSGQVQKKITTQDIADVLIPIGCDEEVLSRILDNAHRYAESKYREAEQSLRDFQNSIITQHNIIYTSEKKLCFSIKLSDIDGVIDVKRYYGTGITSSNLLTDICTILDEKENVERFGQNLVDWIRIDDLPNTPTDIENVRTIIASEMEGTFFEVKQNDILVARLGPTILNHKIVLVRKVERTTLASTEFLVLRCKDGYNPEAVMAILKTDYYRDLMYSRSRGSTPSRYRLNREDALNLPFPDIRDSQELLAREALRVRNEVLQLRREASDEWAEAKAQFEKELLGE